MSIPLKIVILGESGVGKTSVINRYVTGNFQSNAKPTIGAAFLTKEYSNGQDSYDLMIWDTAGQEEYRGLAPMYYRNASIAIVMFDITQKSSFEAINYWIKDLKENAGPEIGIIVCANKIDKNEDRFTDNKEFSDFATKHCASYVESSAVSGEGVDLLFQTAVTVFSKSTVNTVQPISPPVVKEEKGGCNC